MALKNLHRIKAALLAGLVILALVMPTAAHAQGGVHVVQRGETLYSIAVRYGTSVQAIMQANGLRNANYIWVGQRLRIPGAGGSSGGSSAGSSGGVHVVQYGETLYSIARRYGTSIQAIMQANGLSNPNFIWVGQRLRVSGAASSSGGSSSGGGTTSSGGTIHVVQRGETLSSIAQRYGTSVSALVRANGLRNANFIWVGQRLRITGGGGGSSLSGGGSTTSTGGGGGKWIDIDLSSQRLTAMEGNTAVQSMVVSTGIARYPTPTGRFRILSKYPSVNMSGPGYYLPGVPHTMFFYRGYAIHGTYWHNNFGTPMSHGCINLTRADAAWIYSWAPVGTQVVIHW
jgi:LysM repeat protein